MREGGGLVSAEERLKLNREVEVSVLLKRRLMADPFGKERESEMVAVM